MLTTEKKTGPHIYSWLIFLISDCADQTVVKKTPSSLQNPATDGPTPKEDVSFPVPMLHKCYLGDST